MPRTEQLNNLFDEWEAQQPEEAQYMCRDGIVCEEHYETTNPKILFIAKEPNNPPPQEGFDFREWWGRDGPQYLFSWRLCQWAYGIWNGFPPLAQFDREADPLNIMRSIAFMNLKKVGGEDNANLNIIRAITERDQNFLQQQIEIIDPDVIVGCVGRDLHIWLLLFPGIVFHDCGFDIDVAHVAGRKKKVPVIDFYHPSYRVPRAMSYCLLGRVFQTIQA